MGLYCHWRDRSYEWASRRLKSELLLSDRESHRPFARSGEQVRSDHLRPEARRLKLFLCASSPFPAVVRFVLFPLHREGTQPPLWPPLRLFVPPLGLPQVPGLVPPTV